MFRLKVHHILVLAAVAFGPGSVYAKLSSDLPIEQLRERTRENYDKVYPFYIEACSMTVLKRKDKTHGGSAGHAVAFVKGICRDVSSPYPRVKLCNPGYYSPEQEAAGIGYNDIHNPQAGIGFSANKEFKNVNWVGTPGRDMFFRGGIKDDEMVTKEALDNIADRLVTLGTHRGIKLQPATEAHWDHRTSYERFAARYSVDTGVAMNLARHLQCVRVPIKESMLSRVVDYLNKLNDHYFKTEDYTWSGLNDNCTHFVDNMLAAVGFMPFSDTTPDRAGVIKKISDPVKNFAIPADSILRVSVIGNWWPLGAVPTEFNSDEGRESLYLDHWLPTQHGTLVDLVSAHRQDKNAVFVIPKDKGNLFMLARYYGGVLVAEKLLNDPASVDIRANLAYFKRRYEEFLAQKNVVPANVRVFSNEKPDQIELMLRSQVTLQLKDVEEKLSMVFSNDLQ